MRATGRIRDTVGRLLAVAARAVDRRLDALGLAPPLLGLPPRVRDDLWEVFGDTIDLSSVTIRRGHVPGVRHLRAFALPGLIYLGADPGVVRSGPGDDAPPRATPTLVHELVHVWQGRFLGPRYIVSALVEQMRYGRGAYDWRAVLDSRDGRRVEPGAGSPSVRVEAHAQLVSEAYARRYGFGSASAGGRSERDERAMESALTVLRAGRVPPGWGRAV